MKTRRRSTTEKRGASKIDGNIKFLPHRTQQQKGGTQSWSNQQVGLLRFGWGKQMGEMITSHSHSPDDDVGDVDNVLGGVFSSYTRAPYWVYLLSSLMGMRR